MSISTPFIRRPVATSLLTSAILLVGIAAYALLPVAPLPQVDFPTIQVNGKLPGADPQDDRLLGGTPSRWKPISPRSPASPR